jgi:heme-degrading monooxygenase HmoA
MISRQWRSLAKAGLAKAYIEHLRQETFPKLRQISGFVEAAILARTVDRGVEFLIVTHWTSMEAIQQFAGQDPEVAVVPEKVERMMIEYDRSVRHYEIIEESHGS